jgi:hypothetical protein
VLENSETDQLNHTDQNQKDKDMVTEPNLINQRDLVHMPKLHQQERPMEQSSETGNQDLNHLEQESVYNIGTRANPSDLPVTSLCQGRTQLIELLQILLSPSLTKEGIGVDLLVHLFTTHSIHAICVHSQMC